MTSAELLTRLRSRGLSVAADGNALIVRPRDLLTDELRAAIRAHKPAILAEFAAANNAEVDPAVEARRRRVVALLDQHPDWRYAVIVETSAEPALVVVHVGIRGRATGEVVIAQDRYDPVEFMRYLDRAVQQTPS